MNNTAGLLKKRLHYGWLAPQPFRVVLTNPALWAITLLASVINFLIGALTQRIGIQIMRTLAEIRDPRAIAAMLKATESDSAVMSYWAAAGLEALGLNMVYLKPE